LSKTCTHMYILNRCEKKMMAGIIKNMITGEIDMTRTTECYTVYKNMDI